GTYGTYAADGEWRARCWRRTRVIAVRMPPCKNNSAALRAALRWFRPTRVVNSHHRLEALEGADLDDGAGRLGLDCHHLAGLEGVGLGRLLCSGLEDRGDLHHARDH